MPILYLSWFVWHICLYTLEKYEMSRLNTHTRKVEVEPLKDLIWGLHCFQICKKIRKGGCVFFQFVQTRVTGTCGRFYQERRFFSNLCENFALFLNKIAWVQDKRIVSKKIFGKLALPAETFWKAFLCARAAFFAWRAPILSWPRIMCSQVRMSKFLEPSREMPKIRVFEGKKIILDFP